jgi:pimeloyl-ACP methyl ester carboxylesterase
MAPDVSMKFVEAEGVRVHVDSWGAGPPVLLIHGASSDMGVFQPTVIPLLKDRYRLTAYDRPGMGFTPSRPPRAETMAVQAKVAADVIEAMHIERPIVVAHSYGAAVALRLALDRPGLISGLVLIAPLAYRWPGGVSWHLYWSANPVIGRLFNAAAQPFANAAARDGVKDTFFPRTAPDDYFEKAGVARATRPFAMRSNGLDLMAAKREVTAQQDRYPEIRLPVGILVGDGDTVVNPGIHSEHLARVLPNVRMELLPGVGHVPHEIEPQKLAELVDWVQAKAQSQPK